MNTRLFLFFLLSLASQASSSIYVVHDNSNNHGMFSCFTTIIGLLDSFDKGECEGAIVDYKNKGLYYEPTKGSNWWNYYFEPIHLIRNKSNREILSPHLHHHFALKTLNDIPVQRIRKLIKKYIHVKPYIKKEVAQFASRHFGNAFVIGVHYRGTDKCNEAPKVSYQKVFNLIKQTLKKYKPPEYIIFLATDEKQMVDFLKERFTTHLVYTKSIRSENGQPTHFASRENYKKGKEALLDCLLLARCHYLIRTSSNLSLCSTYFNPKLIVELINPGIYDKR